MVPCLAETSPSPKDPNSTSWAPRVDGSQSRMMNNLKNPMAVIPHSAIYCKSRVAAVVRGSWCSLTTVILTSGAVNPGPELPALAHFGQIRFIRFIRTIRFRVPRRLPNIVKYDDVATCSRKMGSQTAPTPKGGPMSLKGPLKAL